MLLFLFVLFMLLCISFLAVEFSGRTRPSQSTGRTKPPNQVTFGGYLIIFSACLSFASLVLGWADAFLFALFRFGSQSGLALGMIVTITIWLYPVYAAFKRTRLLPRTIILYAIAGLIVTVVLWHQIDNTRKFLVIDVDPGIGMYIFTLAGVTLVTGMILDFLQHLVRKFVAPRELA